MNTCIAALGASEDMRSLDVHLAQFAASMDESPAQAVAVATALASRAVAQGDVCVCIDDCINWAALHPQFALPSSSTAWREILLQSRALKAEVGSIALLVLDDADRIYLMRYFGHEQTVAKRLLQKLGQGDEHEHGERLELGDGLAEDLDQLFPPLDGEPDWQRVAVAVALRQRFCVISGGPGTGKTRTVARLLCLLQHRAQRPLRMMLSAPTGKAAARLAQSIQRELPELRKKFPQATALLPTEASTVHRLLGYRSSGNYLHNADNPLALDLLLVDEASMLDLAMMARLLSAIPSQTRVILLGDRDQLASVEAGNVLADICADHFDYASAASIEYLRPLCNHAAEHLKASDQAIADGICLLRRSYRFDKNSEVASIAAAINNGDWPSTKRLLQAGAENLLYIDAEADYLELVGKRLTEHFRALLKCENAREGLQYLTQFQLLCGLRRGAAGVEDVNLQMAQLLRRAGVIGSEDQPRGRPIMVQQNDYGQGLYNGDVGLIWPDENGAIRAYFDDGEGGLRSVLPARLPQHESCYAMTVHKTQGSEFQQVCILLPEQSSAVLTRQLLYTGVTRAREKLMISGPLSVLEKMVSSDVQRQSGLRDALNHLSPSAGDNNP